jgi:hypothetical protein
MKLPDYCSLYVDEGETFKEAKEQIDRLIKTHPSQVFFNVVGYPDQKEEALKIIERINHYSFSVLGFSTECEFFSRDEFDGIGSE